MTVGRVLDVSALTDAASGGTIYVRSLIRLAIDRGIVLAVPATALMAAWSMVGAAGRPFLDLLLDLPVAETDVLDATVARDAGLLITEGTDPATTLVAGHVALTARRLGFAVVTADPGPLRAIDPAIDIEPLP